MQNVKWTPPRAMVNYVYAKCIQITNTLLISST